MALDFEYVDVVKSRSSGVGQESGCEAPSPVVRDDLIYAPLALSMFMA